MPVGQAAADDLTEIVDGSSLDKVMLAFTPDQQQEHLLSGLTFEPTPRTARSPARLRKEFALILQRGYAIDDEEAYLGSRCIGAAIFDGSQQVAAAVSVSGPVTRAPREKTLIFARAVKNAAAAISKSLGYCAWIKS